MSIYQQFRAFVTALSSLFLGSPDHSVSTYILLWLVRITTFSLLLRTYLGPWLLALMSDHIRVRSISLWSIRGLYFRKGSRTWKVDKLSYVWSSVQGSRRLAVKIDGVSLEIAKDEGKEPKQKARRHNRNLTLADLNPSPLARHAWQFLSAIVGFIEPYFRPIIRTYVIACLRVGIQWLPKITQAVSFDLQSMAITFSDIPGAKIAVGEVNLNTTLALIYLEQDSNSNSLERAEDQQGARVVLGMGVWRKRLAESFQRSLDKALGESRGTATMSLKISNVIGSMPRAPLKSEYFSYYRPVRAYIFV